MTDNRESIIRALVEAGMARSDTQQVLDLADHAATEATKTLMRICDTAPPHLAFLVAFTACNSVSLLMGLAAQEAKQMKERSMR